MLIGAKKKERYQALTHGQSPHFPQLNCCSSVQFNSTIPQFTFKTNALRVYLATVSHATVCFKRKIMWGTGAKIAASFPTLT